MTTTPEPGSIEALVEASIPPKITKAGRKTFAETVEEFEAVATWLTDGDQPALTMLYNIADELDRKFTAALVAQFGLVYRDLRKREDGGGTDPADEVAEAMKAATAMRAAAAAAVVAARQ